MLNSSTIQSNTDDKSHLFESTPPKYTRHSTIRKQVITHIPVDDNESAAIEIQENKPMLSSVVNTSNDNLPLHCISTECSTSNDSSHTGNNRIILNVGGIKHEVMWRTLARLPYTRLGRLAELRQSTILLSCPISHDELLRLCDDYDLSNGEFFFDRSSRSFTSIINFYRTGKLHLVDDICVISFHDDLIYWGIEECYLELCCLNKYYQKKEYVLDEIKKESELTQVEKHDTFGQGYCSNIKRKIWDLVEHPQTSIAARIIVFISIAFILLSTLTLIIGTIEGIGCTPNMTNIEMNEEQTSSNHRISQQDKIPDECNEPLFLFLIELICISWFTIEYIIRIFTTPNRCKFLKSLLNIIDLIAIVPFYISITLETIYMDNIKDLQSVRKTVQVFRVLRIVRILKLARYSTDLQSLGYTLKRSSKELFMLLMFLGISILLFSSLAYYAEKDGNAIQFRSIPHAFWWAIVTMTTVGYGDMYPKSVSGKLIGSVCGICGVLVIALPIPIIVNNFSDYYKEQQQREKFLKRREAIEMDKTDRSRVFTQSQIISNTNSSDDSSTAQRRNAVECVSCLVHTNDESLYDLSYYDKLASSSPTKQMSHTLHLFSDNNQNIKEQDVDVKEILLPKK